MLSHEEKCFYFPLYGRAESGKAIQESQAGVGEGLSPDLEVHASPEYIFFENDLHAHSHTHTQTFMHTHLHTFTSTHTHHLAQNLPSEAVHLGRTKIQVYIP